MALNQRFLQNQFDFTQIKNPYLASNNTEGLLSRQFLEELKSEIKKKIKPSKSILEALKHSNVICQAYKSQVQELKNRINLLNEQNQDLRAKIKHFKQNTNMIPDIRVIPPKKVQKFDLVLLEVISLKKQFRESQYNFEMQMLKQQLKHFQEYKAIKQLRFQQMVERQAKLAGQISIITYKNQMLQTKIKILQQKLKIKQQAQNVLLNNSKSESSQKFNEYINQEDEIQVVQKLSIQRRLQQNYLDVNYNKSLMVSCTEKVIIQQEYNIQNQMNKSVKNCKEFNQIDAILQSEVPKIKTQSSLSDKNKSAQQNLNSSIICIDLNAQNNNYAQRVKQNENQSIISINLNAERSNISSKTQQNLNPSIVYINLDVQDQNQNTRK